VLTSWFIGVFVGVDFGYAIVLGGVPMKNLVKPKFLNGHNGLGQNQPVYAYTMKDE
jgi:hypothetical protein